MYKSGIKGMLVWGMNPAVSSSNLNQTYAALANLDWLAAFDLWETDTSVFWQRPGANLRTLKLKSFFSRRPIPWKRKQRQQQRPLDSGGRYQAVKPHGDAKSDLWYANRLALELKKLYKDDRKPSRPSPLSSSTGIMAMMLTNVLILVAKEINGYTVADKKQLANFLGLRDDGSTAGGCWIYSGYYPGPDKKDNKAAARDKRSQRPGPLSRLVFCLAGEPADYL